MYDVAGNLKPWNIAQNYLAGKKMAEERKQQEFKNALATRQATAQEQNYAATQANALAENTLQREQFDELQRQRQKEASLKQEQERMQGFAQVLEHLDATKGTPAYGQILQSVMGNAEGMQWLAGNGITPEELQNPDALNVVRAKLRLPPKAQEKFNAPGNYLVNGKPTVAQVGDRGTVRTVEGLTPYQAPRAGMSITSPDGTQIQIGGDGNPVKFGTATRTQLEKDFTNAQGNALALQTQLQKYKPEFSTYAGQIQAGKSNLKDKLGVDMPEPERANLEAYATWKSETNALLSQYLNQLSGAAISPAEEKRLRAGFPNDEDGPQQYQAKAAATMRRFALLQARAAYILSHPEESLSTVSIEGMQDKIVTEANVLAKSYMSNARMPEAEAKARAAQETRARYGIK